MAKTDQDFTKQETEKRRDEALRRALSMPPNPKITKKAKKSKKKAPAK